MYSRKQLRIGGVILMVAVAMAYLAFRWKSFQGKESRPTPDLAVVDEYAHDEYESSYPDNELADKAINVDVYVKDGHTASVVECPAGMVEVPGGVYLIIHRRNVSDFCDSTNSRSESFERKVRIPRFCIDKYEASQPDASEKYIGSWRGEYPIPKAQSKKNKLPWVDTLWEDAKKACENAGKRLPTQEEWQVAFSSDGAAWPWGKEWLSENKCHVGKEQGIYPTGACCFRAGSKVECSELEGNKVTEVCEEHVCDMVGNVSEWVEGEIYEPHCSNPDDSRKIILGGAAHIYHGIQNALVDQDSDGCLDEFCDYSLKRWSVHFHRDKRTKNGMYSYNPEYGYGDDGFRCALSLSGPS